jgi:hypothetical protein
VGSEGVYALFIAIVGDATFSERVLFLPGGEDEVGAGGVEGFDGVVEGGGAGEVLEVALEGAEGGGDVGDVQGDFLELVGVEESLDVAGGLADDVPGFGDGGGLGDEVGGVGSHDGNKEDGTADARR